MARVQRVPLGLRIGPRQPQDLAQDPQRPGLAGHVPRPRPAPHIGHAPRANDGVRVALRGPLEVGALPDP